MKTIQYMGSKRNLLDFIDESIQDYISNKDQKIKVFYDAFSGSGRVANHFSKKYSIISSDKQHFTKVINDAYLNNHIKDSVIDEFIEKLNDLDDSFFEETDQWFTKNYSTDDDDGNSVGDDGNPKIWTTRNARKIDMIRTKLDDLTFLKDTKRDREIKAVLLLSLILGINKVSNVLGHQNGYLKKWCANAKKDLVLENPKTYSPAPKLKSEEHKNLQGDIFKILPTIKKADITYFDPPYGTNNENLSVATRYSSFYHLWNTVVINDRPVLFGKAGKPISTKGWTADLEKNKRELIKIKFEQLLLKSDSPYVALSYSNQGLLTKKELDEVFKEAGCNEIACYEQSHKINSQSTTAKKKGEFIDRDEDTNSLIEYFFIGTKPKIDKGLFQTLLQKVIVRFANLNTEKTIEYIEKTIKLMSITDENGDGVDAADVKSKIADLEEEVLFLKKMQDSTNWLKLNKLILNQKPNRAKGVYSINLKSGGNSDLSILSDVLDKGDEMEAQNKDIEFKRKSETIAAYEKAASDLIGKINM